MIEYVNGPTAIEKLLVEKRNGKNVMFTEKLRFYGVMGFDVYNISQEFSFQGRDWIAGRVEKRDCELSGVRFFRKDPYGIYEITDYSFSLMQDPSITTFDQELVLGATAIEIDADRHITNWHTDFYKGASLAELKPFLKAPDRMKDVRLHKQGLIHLFTRPQGGPAGRGKIGYEAFSSLEEITTAKIQTAPLLQEHFIASEWGGVNQVITLDNGLLGIAGHIAKMSEGDVRHYYGMVFCFNPETRKSSRIKIICERSDFPSGPAKRPDLEDVIFMGGIVRNRKKKTVTVYVGASDCESYLAQIPDPFLEYEE